MRILGIDMGGSSIKAVEMDSAFGRYEIHDYHETPVTREVPVQVALDKLIKSLPKSPDRIVASLQPGQATFRSLKLPTKNKKNIHSGVNFELEDELPFPIENSVYDYTILSQSKEGSSIHVAASLNQHLEDSLAVWKQTAFSPDVITTEPWAYQTLLNKILPAGPQEFPVLLIQMGHHNTTFYLHWKGAPLLFRESTWGGRDLTQEIARQFGISIEQAESLKQDQGSLASADMNTNPEQANLQACLEKGLAKLLSELKQLRLLSRTLTSENIGLVYIAGGSSLLPGLAPWLESRLNTPTQPLLALSSISPSGVHYSHQTDARFLLAASLAYCVVGQNRTRCINFRKGEFSKQVRARQINVDVLKRPLLAVGIVTLCMFTSLIVQSRVIKANLSTTDSSLEKSVRSFFGTLSPSALKTYMSSTNTLKTSINRELTKKKELSRLFSTNSKSPLEILSRISAGIPKDIVTDLLFFQAGTPISESYAPSDTGSSTVTLTFLVSNPQVAERLASALNTRMTQVQRGKMEEVPSLDNLTKKWKITFSGKPTEDSSGS